MSVLHVLLCGTSTRAAAASAARAGFRVTALDAFADLDQHPAVRALSMPRDFGAPPTAAATARAAREIDCDAVTYLSPFENHPRAVSTLAARRALWGNAPEVLRRVRDPFVLAAVLRQHGFAVPAVRDAAGRLKADDPNDSNDSNEWLVKPLRSGGGHRIRPWRGGRIPRGAYLQQRIDGMPGSIAFVAARGDAVPLAISRQLVGDPNFGAGGYRYCGTIVAAADDPSFARGGALFGAAAALARCVASEFGLVGVNGIDFIAAGDVPYPVEVNPRWSASMELVEQLLPVSLFAAHADACVRGVLPALAAGAADPALAAVGKAIVFARIDAAAGVTEDWVQDPEIRDVPRPGERFRAGQPVCTVLATAPDAARCYDALVSRARSVYARLEHALTGRRPSNDCVRA